MKIVLASTSPRRRELIKKLGYEVECAAPDCDEKIDCNDPDEYARELARRKALSVNGDIVIGADTVVAAAGQILGKPENAEEAERMLRLLCGGSHTVITGVCVRGRGRTLVSHAASEVTFKPYDGAVLDKYIADGKCYDKAGGYGLQDEEIRSITLSVAGDEDNVIGLPVTLVGSMLDMIIN